MSDTLPSLGFPPGLLGNTPRRVTILGEGSDWVALDKPAGIGTRAHPWDANTPDLDAALNRQLGREVREFKELNAQKLGSVFYLDPLISGVALFAKDDKGIGSWRNCFGSGLMLFRFLFVTQSELKSPQPIICEKPLVADEKNRRMRISSRRGKRTDTIFRWIGATKGGSLWEATTHFLRPHQIRIHAAAVGLPLAGDRIYGEELRPKSGDGVQHADPAGQASKSFFKTPPLHLASVSSEDKKGPVDLAAIQAPLSRDLQSFTRKAGFG